jgi:hypothetical protein
VQRGISTRTANGEISIGSRAANAWRSVIGTTRADGPIWAISMVRDEADIIEETILNLFDEGVDHVLVADNLSTDATRRVLDSLAPRVPLHVVADPVGPYWQAEKMTLLARAATRLGASWIVPFDADEIWRGEDGRTVAQTLRASSTPVVFARWLDYVPIETVERGRYVQRFPYRLPEQENFGKVAFRANWLARLTMGNHSVALPDSSTSRGLRIAHFRFRSVEQMRQKAITAAAAVRQAGSSTRVDYWFELADGDEQSATAMLQRLTQRDDLILDPVSKWSRGARSSS